MFLKIVTLAEGVSPGLFLEVVEVFEMWQTQWVDIIWIGLEQREKW